MHIILHTILRIPEPPLLIVAAVRAKRPHLPGIYRTLAFGPDVWILLGSKGNDPLFPMCKNGKGTLSLCLFALGNLTDPERGWKNAP
jgi:hypothetical protein